MLFHQIRGISSRKIIFVHGNSQSHHTWDKVVDRKHLLENYSLITFDLPGHGKSFRSDEPQKDYSLNEMAKHLKEFLSNFEKEEYILIGNSLGTNLIGEIATKLINCKGIMLVGPTAMGKNILITDIIKPNPNVAACFMADPTNEQIDLLVEDAAYMLSDESKRTVKAIFNDTDGKFRTRMAEAINNGEYCDELSNLEMSKIPIAVVFGAEEKICFADYLDKVPFAKWKDKTILIANSGHFCQIDQPEKLSETIGEFAMDCFK